MKTFNEFITEGQHNSNESRAGSMKHYTEWTKAKQVSPIAGSSLKDYSDEHKLSSTTHNDLVKHVLPSKDDHKDLLK